MASKGGVRFTASAPGKVNLHLGVGEARRDGYHELTTVFQAVDRREIVHLEVCDKKASLAAGGVVVGMSTQFGVAPPDQSIDTPTNLAWRAVEAVAHAAGARGLPPVRIVVEKNIFVAGGMAGGSADAAAALVAANAYIAHYGVEPLSATRLHELGASLGADVPFCLLGGTALGTGRGDELVSMVSRGTLHWVFINPRVGVSTAEAFSLLDDLRHHDPALIPRVDTSALSRALLSGDPENLAGVLHNDLERAAVTMRPVLNSLLKAGNAIGLRAMVSGSGPTVAVVCRDGEDARNACEQLRAEFPGMEAFTATGPAGGAASH